MASFKSPVDGVKAAMDIRDAISKFNTDREDEILVKIGIHSGPTIMVTLNNRVDYFGQTVNLAARLQGQAKDNQIIISEKIRNDVEVINTIKPRVKSLIQRTVPLKGIKGNSKIFILNYS